MTTSDGAGPEEPEDAPSIDSVDEAAEELYGLARDDFIPRRDELAKAARAAGRREVASDVAGLRKPSVAAWVANQLAREYPDEVEALEDLGASLRAAQQRLEGDALRRLSRQRHDLVNALVERGRRIAREDGVRLGDASVRELERTITAALSESGAARVLAEGRLVSSWEPGAGFGEAGAVSTTRAPARPRPSRARTGRRTERPPARPAGPDAAESDLAESDDGGPDVAGDPAAQEADRQAEREAEREAQRQADREAQRRAERDAADEAAAHARAEADRRQAAAEEAARDADDAERARASAAEAADGLREQLADLRERLSAAEDGERRTSDAARVAAETRSARRRDADDARDAARRAERDAAALRT